MPIRNSIFHLKVTSYLKEERVGILHDEHPDKLFLLGKRAAKDVKNKTKDQDYLFHQP
jgi:hypothetical protein